MLNASTKEAESIKCYLIAEEQIHTHKKKHYEMERAAQRDYVTVSVRGAAQRSPLLDGGQTMFNQQKNRCRCSVCGAETAMLGSVCFPPDCCSANNGC